MVYTEKRIEQELHKHGYKVTPQRRVIIDAIIDSHEHLTPAALHERVLREDSSIGLVTIYRTIEVLAELGEIVLAQVDAVDQNLAGGHLVEAHHQADEGGLAGAGVAHDGHRLARLDGEGDVLQNPFDAGDGGQIGSGRFGCFERTRISCFERARLQSCRKLGL